MTIVFVYNPYNSRTGYKFLDALNASCPLVSLNSSFALKVIVRLQVVPTFT